ncbi:MAG TPA: hypothetical protein VFV66_05445 [Nonomuraea sp.]|nr:hypothetical protein [Nonomuraea sp.]
MANNRAEWWAKIGIFLGADVTGDVPRVDYRWVNFSALTKIDGVDYSGVPTLPKRDDQ